MFDKFNLQYSYFFSQLFLHNFFSLRRDMEQILSYWNFYPWYLFLILVITLENDNFYNWSQK